MPMIYDPTGEPVEIAEGRGDLRFSSTSFSHWGASGSLQQLGGRVVSYGDLFARQPWVASAVMKLLSASVRVPLKAYRRVDDNSHERLRPKDHPLAAALIEPWKRGTQAGLIQALLGPELVHGNSTTQVRNGAGDKISFTPTDYRTVTPVTDDDRGTLLGWTVNRGAEGETGVSLDRMLHVAWWSPLGPLGVSPLQQLGVTLSIEDAAQRYQQALFANGARPPSAITASDEFLTLDPEERQEMLANLRDDITSLYASPDNAGRPALLPPGLDWKPVGHTAVEAELVDQRRVAREEIAAVYMIPPPMIGILDKATYSNIQVQREMFYTDALGPPLVLIEQAINAHLVRGLLREDDVYVEFDFGNVLRGDRLKEMQALREGIGAGVMTPNEARGALNLPSSDDPKADQLWMPTNNLSPINEDADGGLDEEPKPEVTP